MQSIAYRFAAFSIAMFAELLFVSSGAVASPAIGFTPNAVGVEDNATDSNGGIPTSYVLGFEFTANSTIDVTSLGYFDDPSFDPNNPFGFPNLNPTPTGSYTDQDSHNVRLYAVSTTASGDTLIAETTVTAASAPSGDFLYNAIAPVTLDAGESYIIGGVSGPDDPYVYDVQDPTQTNSNGVVVNPAITYDEDLFGTISNPNQIGPPSVNDPSSEPGFFGPNFNLAPAPELSTSCYGAILIILAAACVRLKSRKRTSD